MVKLSERFSFQAPTDALGRLGRFEGRTLRDEQILSIGSLIFTAREFPDHTEAERVVSTAGIAEVDLDRKPHQLGCASRARVAKVESGRLRSSSSSQRYRIPDSPGSMLRAHFGSDRSVNHLEPSPRERDFLADANPAHKGQRNGT
jgi:hypothetical protein